MLSHLRALEEPKPGHVLIFEDDAYVAPWFAKELPRFMRHLPDDWLMCQFGGHHEDIPRLFPSRVSGPVYRYKSHRLCECYLVHADYRAPLAALLRETIKGGGGWTDIVYKELLPKIPVYGPLNPWVTQRPEQSYLAVSDNHGKPMPVNMDRMPIPGAFTIDESFMYYDEVRRLRARNVVEVGVLYGRSSSVVCELVKSNGGDLYCVDLFQRPADCDWLKVYPPGRDPALHLGDFRWWMEQVGLAWDYIAWQGASVEVAAAFDTKMLGSLDLVMIDADHSFESVTADLLAWLPKIRDGGVICGHDWKNQNKVHKVTEALAAVFGREPDRLSGYSWYGHFWAYDVTPELRSAADAYRQRADRDKLGVPAGVRE